VILQKQTVIAQDRIADYVKSCGQRGLAAPGRSMKAQAPLAVWTADACSASLPRRFNNGGMTWSRKRCLIVSGAVSGFATRVDMPTGSIDQEVGELGKMNR